MKYLRSALIACSVTAFCFASVFGAPGDLDLSFGVNGFYTYATGLAGSSEITATLILPDGRIVFAGYAAETDGLPPRHFPTLERVLPNGMADPSFGTGGAVRFPFYGQFRSVAVQPDGKLLMGGLVRDPNQVERPQYLLVRCNSDGSLDTTFNLTGVIRGAYTLGDNKGEQVLLRPDGKILIVGEQGYPTAFAAAQYNPNGTLDTTFGNQGIASLVNEDLPSTVVSAILQPDGKILVAGASGFVLGRFLANGAADTSFGDGGTKWIPLLANYSFLESSVKLQPDGKILVAGWARWSYWANTTVVRLNADGSQDSSFGINGVVLASQGPPDNTAYDLELQPNGKILTVGYIWSPGLEIRRYYSNGSRDLSFGPHGVAATLPNIGRVVKLKKNGDLIIAVGGGTSHKAIRIKGDARTETIRFDFDGDGQADISGFRPSNGTWNLLRSGAGSIGIQWGLSTDILVPADYDGDSQTNVAIYRDGAWKIILADGSYRYASFGQGGDLPRPGDFDGDGKADIAFWRPADGTWNWINSSDGHNKIVYFGTNGDVPLIADIDGDGKTDQTIFRPSTGDWYYLRSSDGHYAALHFGATGDIPVVGDFDGDWKTDISVFRPSDGVWHRLNSTNGHYVPQQFGMNGDIPVPADYDGDGQTDIAVFRPSNNIWYLLNSGSGITYTYYGLDGDRALPSVFLP